MDLVSQHPLVRIQLMLKESTPPLSPFPVSKRLRPPKIELTRTKKNLPIVLEPESPFLKLSGVDNNTVEETLQLSDSDSGSPSPIDSKGPTLQASSSGADLLPDDISKDLAALHQLRNSVKKNLRLRPIRSRGNLPKVDLGTDTSPASYSSFSSSPKSPNLSSALSPTFSSYFTPTLEVPLSPIAASSVRDPTPVPTPAPFPQTTASAITPESLYNRLVSAKRPLLIDTRPAAAHQSFHLRHSINIAIPSLILKRFRKPGGGLPNLDALRQYITSDQEKSAWDSLMSPGGPWDGDVVMYDDEMDPKDKDHLGITAWAIIPVISPLLSYGSVDYLEGGVALARYHPRLSTLIINGYDSEMSDSDLVVDSGSVLQPPAGFQGGMRKGVGLFQLNTQISSSSKPLPEIEPCSSTSSRPRSPLPTMPSTVSSSLNPVDSNINVIDASPSPPPSSISFKKPVSRRTSFSNLRRLDTKSAERLNTNVPKLSVRTKPMRSATLTIPPSLSIIPPQSPGHLHLMYSNHSPPPSARFGVLSPTNDPANYLTPYFTPPHTPGTPKPFLPPSPATARPDLDPPSTEEAFPVFTISTILPNFLFLGPELTIPEHVEALQDLGVRRILNIAAECDDDHGLKLKEVFEKYYKIPMRDTVEEENIAQGVREVCDILDDARLHSAPTYVHCKAGKSRSVTAVMAYLIHANHWTLSRAYSFVLERRKGISPNIGFVSELMTFEEQELGGKSIGVQPASGSSIGSATGPGATETGGSHMGLQDNYSMATGGSHHRRGAHVRESLPPALGALEIGGTAGGPLSAGGLMERVLGDSGQEMEIKDATGRYRHARRAPVDENTLQPMRRVSKAGLESSVYA